VAPADGNGSEWGSLLSGLASVATLPVAIYLTRFSDSYELIHAGWAVPVAALLGLLAVSLARRYRRQQALRLTPGALPMPVRAGRILGILGVCLAASALVAIGVYGLLEYVGRT
jgi:hypothetical protein